VNEIIKKDNLLSSLVENTKISPIVLEALNTLSTGTIPPEAIKTHPGKGGKIFSYVSHIYATKLMNSAMRFLWEFKVVSFEAFDDGSAVALCNLKIFIPVGDSFIEREFQEVGAWESQRITQAKPAQVIAKDPMADEKPKTRAKKTPLPESTPEEKASREYGMTKAMIIASAASRGLLRCMMRAFNIGTEFYEDDEQLTNAQAWKQLSRYAANRGVNEQELIEFMKSKSFKGDQLADRFHEAFSLVYNYVEEKSGIPDDLK